MLCKILDCHGNDDGVCHVLEELFKERPCPFYKSKLRLQLEEEALEENDMKAYRKATRVDRRKK